MAASRCLVRGIGGGGEKKGGRNSNKPVSSLFSRDVRSENGRERERRKKEKGKNRWYDIRLVSSFLDVFRSTQWHPLSIKKEGKEEGISPFILIYHTICIVSAVCSCHRMYMKGYRGEGKRERKEKKKKRMPLYSFSSLSFFPIRSA